MSPNDLLAAAYRMSSGLVHRMVDDLTPVDWNRQPVPGANSAAWVIGHLALTLRNGLRRMNAADVPDFPADLEEKFKTTRQPACDQSDCGDPKVFLAIFDVCLERFITIARSLPADALAGEPDFKHPFTTNKAESILFGSLHIAMHTGQLSTIRRSLGKPPVV